jgi:hypothetical protein
MPPPGLWVRARKKGELASLGDSSVEQASRAVKAQQFIHGNRCFPVVFQQGAQLRARINAARGSTGFDQAVLCGNEKGREVGFIR